MLGSAADDVAVLRVEQVVQESQHDDHVDPPRRLGQRARGRAAARREPRRARRRSGSPARARPSATPRKAVHPEVGDHQRGDRAQDGGGVAAHRDEARAAAPCGGTPRSRASPAPAALATSIDGVERCADRVAEDHRRSENAGNSPWISISPVPTVMTMKPQKITKWYLLPIARHEARPARRRGWSAFSTTFFWPKK